MNCRILLLALCSSMAAVAQAQNAPPVITNSIPAATVFAGAGPLVHDLTAFFQDQDTTKAVRVTTVEGTMEFALYDRQKPITVTNFLRYVNEGRYQSGAAGIFFHRSVTNFVIQSGGFLATGNANGDASPTNVQTFPAIQNEPGISNKRGTLAMAKLEGNPNSATSQWFINLADNSANLDNQNGGFTVFARVLGTGMNVADRIASLPKFNAGGVFNEIPLRNYTSGTIKVDNLVSIPQIVEIPPVPSPLDFTATTNADAVVEPVISGNNLLVRGKIAGTADVTVTARDLDGATVAQTFAVTVINPSTRFANIATRMEVRPDPNALIGSFFIRGSAAKRLLIRATVPSGISGPLADPQLEIVDGGGNIVASNDDWGQDMKQDILDTRLAPSSTRESAVVATLPATPEAAGYTAIVRGANNGIGIGRVEIFDIDSGPGSDLVNIATRGRVDNEPKVMIGSFIISGSGTKRVFIRSLGPSLPVAGTLLDPQLQLVNANGDIEAENDDWGDSPDRDEIAASGVRPNDSRESAVVKTLPAAAFTAIVSGKNGATGVATVEAYQVD